MLEAGFEFSFAISLVLITGFFVSWKPHFFSKNIEVQKPGKTESWTFTISILLLVSFLLFQAPQSYTEWTFFYLVVWLYYISVFDFRFQVIPNTLLILGLAAWLFLYYWQGSYTQLIVSITVLVLGFTFNVIIQKWKGKNGFGWGDIKLCMILALFLGWDVFLVLYISIVLAGLTALVGLVSGKLHRQSRISFAPFLLSGFLLNNIIDKFEIWIF